MTKTNSQPRNRRPQCRPDVCVADGFGRRLSPAIGGGSRLLALSFGLAAVLLFSGCDGFSGFSKDQKSRESTVTSNAQYASLQDSESLDLSQEIETVDSEERALKAFFRARYLLFKAYFAPYELEARGHYAQARALFEKTIKFYIPDLQAMTFGRNPIHASANWYFFRALHDYWARTCVLSGRSTHVDDIEDNAQDAWALAVIQEIARNSDEKDRAKVIAETFRPVKRGLVSQLKYCEGTSSQSRPDSSKLRMEAPQASPPLDNKMNSAKISAVYRLLDMEIERIRKSAEARQAQKLAGLKSARHLMQPHLLAGDPASGMVYPVKARP